MFYSFARVSAVLKLKVDDYYHNGARRRLRLHEKGGKEHDMPVHHLLERILDEYIVVAGLQSGQPLFQKRKFGWNGGNGTSFEPLQRLGCDSETGQGSGFSHT
jgi:integrase